MYKHVVISMFHKHNFYFQYIQIRSGMFQVLQVVILYKKARVLGFINSVCFNTENEIVDTLHLKWD